MTTKLSLRDLELSDKRVLMRVDFNVPLTKEGKVADDSRIVAALPSIQYILDRGGSLILMSHLGRPKGAVKPEFSLKPVAEHLSKLLKRDVKFVPSALGAKQTVDAMKPGDVILLENLRFHAAEEKPDVDPKFAKELASYGDLYVNDAFGTAHRKHASTYSITAHFPEKAACGFLLEKEIAFIGTLVQEPKPPFFAIIGGAKISTKLGVLKSLIEKVDALFLGGGMVYTFMKALGKPIGKSIFEEDQIENAKEIIQLCEKRGVSLHLPIDIVVTDDISGGEMKIATFEKGIEDPFEGVDAGPKTIEKYSLELKKGATILWNGPLGVFEVPPFDEGTNKIARVLAEIDAKVIVGGGDSVAAIKKAKLEDKMTHLSTGGGATLEYLEFGTLPGIQALSEKQGVIK